MEEVCCICELEVNETYASVLLTEKGAHSINLANKERKRDVIAIVGSKVHVICRKRFIDKKDIEKRKKDLENDSQYDKTRQSKRLAIGTTSTNNEHNYRNNCLFCDNVVLFTTSKQSKTSDGMCVRTFDFTESIKAVCDKRQDKWAEIVIGKLEFYRGDLPAFDCVYHKSCDINFRTGRKVPQKYKTEFNKYSFDETRPGRRENDYQQSAFLKTCFYLESIIDEEITLKELQNKMEEYLVGNEISVYETRWLKQKLSEKYGDDIIFSSATGKSCLVTLRETTSNIILNFHKKPKVSLESEKDLIIGTAAKLILSDIKKHNFNNMNTYPTLNDLKVTNLSNFLPESLKIFIDALIKSTDINKNAIAQALLQCVRPRSLIAPLQIGLAIQLYHHFKSRYLIDTLHSFGFCSSYREVLDFIGNAAMTNGSELDGIINDASFPLFIADNVDHNLMTLNGENTFHGMGMIAAVKFGNFCEKVVERRKVTKEEIMQISKVPIKEYRTVNVLPKLSFDALKPLISVDFMINLLWKSSIKFENVIPSWSGLMQVTFDKQNKFAQKDQILFLPIIDLSPSNMTCIQSTLEFLSNLSIKIKKPCIITFDQPLYWKSIIITKNSTDANLQHIVLILGAFHSAMNLLGCIGKIMDNTGLKNVLEEIYGENAVYHMLQGKAYARAVRGNLIVAHALSTLLFEKGYFESDIQLMSTLYNSLMENKLTPNDIENNLNMKDINNRFDILCNDLSSTSRNAKLWLNYLKLISILQNLIRADRLGNFDLHLSAMQKALPIYAAAGHFNYVKSAYLYIQNMHKLSEENPSVFEQFRKGNHVVKRSERNWAGLPTDLVIEQTLMRSLKTSGGMTRGGGMSEIQRSLWLLSSPITSKYSMQMEENINVLYTTSEQHATNKYSTKSRIQRDMNDTMKVVEYLRTTGPFDDDPSLHNITTGEVADESINVDKFFEIGESVVRNLEGLNIFDYTFHRKDAIKNMSSKSCIKSKDDNAQIDPALLFQRLLVLAKSNTVDIADIIEYELSPYPPALFSSTDMLRKSDKSQLSKAITSHIKSKCDVPVIENITDQYILDGGSLIHRVLWQKNLTYGEIADKYCNFVLSVYHEAVVIFDGYDSGPSTKDITHSRRYSALKSPTMNFTEDMMFTSTREKFLANPLNKQKFIKLVGTKLERKGCTVIHSREDADLNIAMYAISYSAHKNVTVIAEDTDILILLLSLATNDNQFNLHMKSDRLQKNKDEQYIHDIKFYRKILGENIVKGLLFLHAFSGCDTTSSFYSIGKLKCFQKYLFNQSLQEIAYLFSRKKQDHISIKIAGERAAIILYNGKTSDNLKELRSQILTKKIMNSKIFVEPKHLPPTEAALKFHSYRSYFQVMKWMNVNDLNPEEWGWQKHSGIYYPTNNDQEVAPESLLRIVRCSCKGDCSSLRCSCRKVGIKCTTFCQQCQLQECINIHTLSDDEKDSDEEVI